MTKKKEEEERRDGGWTGSWMALRLGKLYFIWSIPEDSISLFRHWMERFGSKIGKVFALWLLD